MSLQLTPDFYKLAAEMAAKAKEANDEPHNAALEMLRQHHGLVAAHSTGSGKTLLSLKAAKGIGGNSLFITPASLVGNVHKEIKKHNMPVNPDVMSYEAAANRSEELAKKNYDLVVLDEAHKIRNPDSDRTKAIRHITSHAKNRLLLTATPMYNSPRDMNVLVNTAANNRDIPEDSSSFKKKFHKDKWEVPTVHNMIHGALPHKENTYVLPRKYKKDMRRYVHQYDATKSEEAQKHFPSVHEETVSVPMSHRQKRVYNYYESSLDPVTTWRVKHGLPLEKRDAAKLNSFSIGLRQISNGMQSFSKHPEKEQAGPKIHEAVERLDHRHKTDPNFRGVVYSNFLNSGINPYSQELKKRGIPHQILTGSNTKEERTQMVENYNKGKSPVMLISSAGSEGLDLKGTKLVQVMEPHFNDSKIAQVRGRAVRYKSHDHLPENERHVDIENYVSTRHGGLTIDEYLQQMAAHKKKVSDKTMRAIEGGYQKAASIGSIGAMGATSLSAPTTGPTGFSSGVSKVGAGVAVAGAAGVGTLAMGVGAGVAARGVRSVGNNMYLKANAEHEGESIAREFHAGLSGGLRHTSLGASLVQGAVSPETAIVREKAHEAGRKAHEYLKGVGYDTSKGDTLSRVINGNHELSGKHVKGMLDHTQISPESWESLKKGMSDLTGTNVGEDVEKARKSVGGRMIAGAAGVKNYAPHKNTILNRILHSEKLNRVATRVGASLPMAAGVASGNPVAAIGGAFHTGSEHLFLSQGRKESAAGPGALGNMMGDHYAGGVAGQVVSKTDKNALRFASPLIYHASQFANTAGNIVGKMRHWR